MADCSLAYIPERLHQNENPPIETFSIGEFLYRRCSQNEIANPYANIPSIAELSHNRSFMGQSPCEPEDVLFNIREEDTIEKYEDKVICTLSIVSLNENNIYIKSFEETKNEIAYIATLTLIHDPEPCMYHHCVFRVTLNGTILTLDNYNNSIIKKLNKIRNSIRTELASMIYTKEVDQDSLIISTPNDN